MKGSRCFAFIHNVTFMQISNTIIILIIIVVATLTLYKRPGQALLWGFILAIIDVVYDATYVATNSESRGYAVFLGLPVEIGVILAILVISAFVRFV